MDPISVLVVDDDPICIFIAEEQLKNNFRVDTVTSGHAALEAIEKRKYDVILMDINLNDQTMDGIRTMRTIRHQSKHRYIKILAVTASSDAREWYMKQGFDGHFMKPLKEEGILAEINRQMNQPCIIKALG